MFAYARFFRDYVRAIGNYWFASTVHKAMPTLTPIEPFTKITPLVTRVLGQNPGPFTLQGTNTYLVGSGEEKILIDAGEPNIEAYTNLLGSTLTGSRIVAVIITHWHHDHVGGLNDVFTKVIGSKVPVYKIKREGFNEGSDIQFVEDGHEVTVPGATVRFVATPGHTADHASLWLEEEKAIFAGDCILGEGTSVFECLHEYMKSLEKLKGLNPEVIYPGHGPVVSDPFAKITEYITHRMKRETEIIEFMSSGEERTSMDITNAVYSNTPASVMIAALNNVRLHLNKLVKDGKVEKTGFEMYRFMPTSKQ
ncbi:unnamed protein product, partial [Mesorhabditis belari]|uniref:Beta-lactamase-like protein 2 homolog n=1 Tax=Mesorhabditis belari TaxID=2138241 RepID=A0AAF3EEJ8_9BILA